MFAAYPLDPFVVRTLPMRVLAHLGDAVFDLFEREREVLSAVSARELHQRIVKRVRAEKQAELMNLIKGRLRADEDEIVRQARNVKARGRRSTTQSSYRKATSFEALIGYLYLTDRVRLRQVLEWTVPQNSSEGP